VHFHLYHIYSSGDR